MRNMFASIYNKYKRRRERDYLPVGDGDAEIDSLEEGLDIPYTLRFVRADSGG